MGLRRILAAAKASKATITDLAGPVARVGPGVRELKGLMEMGQREGQKERVKKRTRNSKVKSHRHLIISRLGGAWSPERM